jgi:transitional endoplasmic reticulum ATPase
MKSMVEIKTGHENACAEFVKARDYARAAAEAARAAACGFALAGRTSGPVSEAHTRDAEGWVALAEELKGRSSKVLKCESSKVGRGAEAEATDGGEWLVAERPDVTFDDIAGLADAKRVIQEMVVYPMRSPEKARALGLNAGGGVLVYGPPGTGKTMLGKAVAGVLECPFYYASGADLRSKWYGESEQRLSRLLRAAQAQPMAVLFLDEVEALLPKRRDDGSSGADNRLVTQFLADVGGFRDSENVLLILGATNKPWEIDEAVFRSGRFDEKLYIGPPDAGARLGIFKKHLGSAACEASADIGALSDALEGFSGSDVAAVVHTAKRLALGRAVAQDAEAVLTGADFEAARARVPNSITDEMLEQFEAFKRQRFG